MARQTGICDFSNHSEVPREIGTCDLSNLSEVPKQIAKCDFSNLSESGKTNSNVGDYKENFKKVVNLVI